MQDGKFHPHNKSKGIRKSRDPKEKIQGIRMKKTNVSSIKAGGKCFCGRTSIKGGLCPSCRDNGVFFEQQQIKQAQRNPKNIGAMQRSAKNIEVIKIPALEVSRAKMEQLLKKSKFNDNEAERESFREGFSRGITFAEVAFDDIDKVKIGTNISKLDFGADEFETDFGKIIKTVDDAEEFIRQSAFGAEENDRSFSPFEVTANELNDREFNDKGEQVTDAFDAFEDGLGEAINWYVGFVFEKNKRLVK
jgi:hypothetical protein